MYPAVQVQNYFPISHPIIHTERFPEDLDTTPFLYRGIIKCDIVPPHELLIPVLPSKINNKLHFTLCKLCSEINNQEKCNHNSDQRALTGVWTTPELQMAIKKGYRLTYCYEVWEWKKWDEDIFKEYVETFFKIKVMASGFPSGCNSDSEKEKYVKELAEGQGIIIKKSQISYNKGLRTVSKGALVNLWGK